MTKRLHFHFSLSCIGEGNGSPLWCSCLENPRDGGAWWAAVYRVAQSRTRLKRLSSSSSNLFLGEFLASSKLERSMAMRKRGVCWFQVSPGAQRTNRSLKSFSSVLFPWFSSFFLPLLSSSGCFQELQSLLCLKTSLPAKSILFNKITNNWEYSVAFTIYLHVGGVYAYGCLWWG